MIEDFLVSIDDIIVAHKFTMKSGEVCDYIDGRKFCGLVYCIDGEAVYCTSHGEKLVIKSGDVLFVSANTQYSVRTKCQFRHYTVNFYANAKKSRGEKAVCLLSQKDIVVLREKSNAYFAHIFEKICSCWVAKYPGYTMAATGLLYELLSQFLLRKYFDKSQDMNMLRILPAKEYIEQNFLLRMNIDMLANMCNMSRTNFRRAFLQSVGISPMAYRASICVLRAKDLLLCEIYSVNEVGRMCGFDDANYFCRFFKRHVGITPGEYKKRIVGL